MRLCDASNPPCARPESTLPSIHIAASAEVFHDVLSEQQLDAVLERIADTLGDLIPFDAFTIYQADETRRVLIPLMSRDKWADEIMGDQPIYGEGITGWVVENREAQLVNHAHLDPRESRARHSPGRAGGAHLRPAHRARHGQGDAQRLPPRRRRSLHRGGLSSPSAAAGCSRARARQRARGSAATASASRC